MTNRKKEIAKFFCGFEAFHALSAAYFWLSGTTIIAFGITVTPALSMAGTVIHAAISVVLGVYAWRSSTERVS